MDKKIVVVCGATGQQGGAVVDALLERDGFAVRALVRNPDRARALEARGVGLVGGDFGDRESLVRAFSGAAAVFGVTQPWSADYRSADVAREIAHGKALADASLAAKTTLVMSTVMLTDEKPTGIPHVDSKLEIEAYMKKVGVPSVVLGPGSFMDNIGMSFFPVRKGKVRGFADGEAKVPLIACRDIGRAAANVIAELPQRIGSRINLIEGLYSGEDICRTLSRLRGGERFRWSAPPKILMRLFAREFYKMRVAFEEMGRPPRLAEYDAAVRETAALVPDHATLEDFLRARGYERKAL